MPTPPEGTPGGGVPPTQPAGTPPYQAPPTQPTQPGAPYGAAPAYQPPPAAPAGAGGGTATNGMAIAALVFGILSFVCLPFLGPVLAVVFGLVGLSKAKQTGSGRGMSIAGIVLGILGLLVAIIATVVIVLAADEAADDIAGNADPDTYELVADTCEIDDFGFVTYTGTIENTSDETKNFTVNAEFRDSDTDRIVDSSLADIVFDLPPGDTSEWSITGSTDAGTSVTCTVTSVENFFN